MTWSLLKLLLLMFREHQLSLVSILGENETKEFLYFCEMELLKCLLPV